MTNRKSYCPSRLATSWLLADDSRKPRHPRLRADIKFLPRNAQPPPCSSSSRRRRATQLLLGIVRRWKVYETASSIYIHCTQSYSIQAEGACPSRKSCHFNTTGLLICPRVAGTWAGGQTILPGPRTPQPRDTLHSFSSITHGLHSRDTHISGRHSILPKRSNIASPHSVRRPPLTFWASTPRKCDIRILECRTVGILLLACSALYSLGASA